MDWMPGATSAPGSNGTSMPWGMEAKVRRTFSKAPFMPCGAAAMRASSIQKACSVVGTMTLALANT